MKSYAEMYGAHKAVCVVKKDASAAAAASASEPAEIKWFKCRVCSEEFDTQNALELHTKSKSCTPAAAPVKTEAPDVAGERVAALKRTADRLLQIETGNVREIRKGHNCVGLLLDGGTALEHFSLNNLTAIRQICYRDVESILDLTFDVNKRREVVIFNGEFHKKKAGDFYDAILSVLYGK